MPEVIFAGPAGRLEGRYHHNPAPESPVAIVLHPDPRHGGTMNNRVVYSLFHAYVERGFSVLRFNFRGVGRSQGRFDRGEGELSDAAAALDWMQGFHPNARQTWISGFSFGAWIAMQLLMRRPESSGFTVVAPPANFYDFGFLAPCPCPGLIVQGTADEVVPEASVAKLVEKIQKQRGLNIDYKLVEGADHFFKAQLDQVKAEIHAYLDRRMPEVDAETAAA